MLLSHADRARFYAREQRGRFGAPGRQIKGTVLVDGVVRATWRTEREGDRVTLLVDHATAFHQRDADAVQAEGRRMLRFLEGDRAGSGGEVRLVALEDASASSAGFSGRPIRA